MYIANIYQPKHLDAVLQGGPRAALKDSADVHMPCMQAGMHALQRQHLATLCCTTCAKRPALLLVIKPKTAQAICNVLSTAWAL